MAWSNFKRPWRSCKLQFAGAKGIARVLEIGHDRHDVYWIIQTGYYCTYNLVKHHVCLIFQYIRMIDVMDSSSYWYVRRVSVWGYQCVTSHNLFHFFGPRWSKSLQFDVAIALYLVFDAVVQAPQKVYFRDKVECFQSLWSEVFPNPDFHEHRGWHRIEASAVTYYVAMWDLSWRSQQLRAYLCKKKACSVLASGISTEGACIWCVGVLDRYHTGYATRTYWNIA